MDDDDFAELFRKLPRRSSTGATWQDVGAELEALGRTLGDVIRGAWQQQDDLGPIRDTLQGLIAELNRSVEGTPEAKGARDQLLELVGSLRAAITQATAEVRPDLVQMLRQANAELRRRTNLDE
jgi:hypothetical protein